MISINLPRTLNKYKGMRSVRLLSACKGKNHDSTVKANKVQHMRVTMTPKTAQRIVESYK